MRKIILVVLVVAMAASLFACAPTQAPTESADDAAKEPATTEQAPAASEMSGEKPYIPLIALGFGHQFWQAVKKGAEEAAEKYDVEITFEGPEQETMVDKQVDMLKAAIAKNPSAIAMAAIDPAAVEVDLKAEKDKGIPIVGFDAGCGELADATCATDSYTAGELAAENAIRLLDGEGKVAIVGHSQTVVDAVARVEGFVNYLSANAPNIVVVDTQYGEGDHLKSADIAKVMIQGDPEIQLFYGSNEGAAVGIYNGLKEINKIGEVLIIGFDSSKALKDAVRSGEIAGAITQDPVGMGYKTVETAVKLMDGEMVEAIIDTGCYWYDAANMDDPKIAPLLYD